MRIALTFCLVAIAFAGCIGNDPGTDGDDVTILPDVLLEGMVQTSNFNPIEGATVTVTGPSVVYSDGSMTEDLATYTAVTDAGGNFTLSGPPGTHALTVEAANFAAHQGTAILPGSNLTIQLTPLSSDVPYNEAFDFDGTMECAAETLIITPSCDTILTFREETTEYVVFDTQSEFDLTTPRGWQTVVLDVRFDGSAHPGIAGLRASSYTASGDAEVLEYERINQEWASGDFSLRVDAGMDYGDNIPAPDSDGGDDLVFRFFPQSHGDDTICVPEEAPETDPRLAPGTCFLGAGFAQDVTFTATATLFVHEPAPQGWTTLGSG